MATSDGVLFEVGPVLRMGWSRRLGGYWIEKLTPDRQVGERIESVAGGPLDDIEDLLDAVVVWNVSEPDDDLLEWGEDPHLLAQLRDAHP